jgi:hypothetical protein
MLMATKAFAWLFLFLTFLNLPVYGFFYSGNNTDNINNSEFSVTGYFSMFSLGNIGQTQNACGY